MLNTLKLAIIDVETTGATASYDRIIEIGIKRVENGEVVQTYSTLVDPECRIPSVIERLTGISDDDVSNAPTFAMIRDEVRAILDGCIFVAHNVRFDYGFIKIEFSRFNESFSAKCLCTVRLSRALFPRFKKHGLSSIIERFKLSCENRHRALDDADVVWQFLQVAQRSVEDAKISKAVSALIKTPTFPPNLKPEIVDALPDSPGVYVMYDATGAPLYVGKSVHMRDRVLSHFSNDHSSGKDRALSQRTADIRTFPTHGELGALLLELRLIQELAPEYNRRPRARKVLTILRMIQTEDGYDTLMPDEVDAKSFEDPDNIWGVFTSERHAKTFLYETAKSHKLCPVLLGLEKQDGKCSHVQIRLCKGACTGDETQSLYNTRIAAAFIRSVKPWPYSGPVMIEEFSQGKSDGHLLIIDQWRLHSAFAYHEGQQQTWLQTDGTFDYECYKLLRRYLAKRPASVKPVTFETVKELVGSC